jgi:hypothetical protein
MEPRVTKQRHGKTIEQATFVGVLRQKIFHRLDQRALIALQPTVQRGAMQTWVFAAATTMVLATIQR